MTGIDCVIEGLRLIRHAGLRRYVIVPLVINVVILVTIFVYGILLFDTWIDAILGQVPDWAAFLAWLIWPIAVFTLIVFLIFGFTVLANIVAAPFNAVLSTRVEERLSGRLDDIPEIAWWKVVPRAIGRELGKIVYFLPRLVALVILTMIPVINLVAPILLLLFSAWMMAIEYTDYAADNNEVGFRDLRRRLARTRLQSLLFGILVYVLMAIPLVNLVLMPAAVAGGTVFWVRHLRTCSIVS